MRLSRFAVHRPVTVAILVGVLIVLGIVAFSRLAVDLYPDIKLPVAAVITTYSGAGPEEVESQVSRSIESIMGTLGNVKEIQSWSAPGSSIVIVRFNWGTDMDFATLNMREKLALIETYLPDGVDKPTVVKMDPTMMPVLQIGVTGGTDLAQLQDLVEDKIKPELERIDGVASVVLTGGLTREVRVDVDPVKIANYGLTMSQITQVLRADNFNLAGGTVNHGDRQLFIRSLQQFENIDDIKNVTVTTPAGANVLLSQVAQITDGYKEAEQYTRVNGKPSIGIHILKQTDANSVKVSEKVRATLQELSKTIPGGIEVGVVFDQADFINQSMGTIKRSMLEGALLAMLVIYVFLRSLPSTLVIATSIPLSVVATFLLMYFSKMTMNMVTMGGVALAIGRIVDDSIVVLESIFRHRQAGKPAVQAAVEGASEVGNAVMAATFTTVAVFFPVVFVEGISAILFKPLAMTVSFGILSSLVVALTIIPLLSSRMMTGDIVHEVKTEEGLSGPRRVLARLYLFLDSLGERYRRVIRWALGHRRLIVVTVTVLMVASVALVPLIGAEFLPKSDAGQIGITIEMDKGTVLQETDRVASKVEALVKAIPEVTTVFTSVGSEGSMMYMTGASSTDTSTLKVMLCKKSQRSRSTAEIAEEIRKKTGDIPGAKITVTEVDPMMTGMTSSTPVNIEISGDDLEVLKGLSDQAVDIVRAVAGTREVQSNLTEGKPEVRIKVDRRKAAYYGITPGQVAQTVQAAFEGTVATRYRVEGDEVDVRVRYQPSDRDDLSELGSLMITTTSGAQVPLSQVAEFELARGPMTITRIHQVRTAQITANISGRDLNSVIRDIQKRMDKELVLPTGYTVKYTGENKEMVESFQSLLYALLLAVVLVYAVMAIQYESFFDPFVIMFSVPTCFIGGAFGLAVTGRTFNVVAFIGVIMLVGIAVSNAIVLVDYIKTLRERGMERNQAIEEAGAVRLRPVLMTALCTIIALFPLALGLGEGGELEAPLATVVIGGLTASTVITLVLVPVVYTIFDDYGRKIGGWIKSRR
ncbi:MAG TPA: efflux RND transporter permease subunit [Syntrophothermus lipocalidus]|nr:efflux RND transporter permease subunit [Syntrophothermus lipocalidus]